MSVAPLPTARGGRARSGSEHLQARLSVQSVTPLRDDVPDVFLG